tara:strand:- start:2921 stop:3547 length:627 start_codon:yes stop_codon:yes gene_type:complete
MVPGCVLSGGEARRLGGKGKALVKIAGSNMIDLVIKSLNRQVSPLVINTRDKTQTLSDKYSHIEDFIKVDGGAGPLSGILSAIIWAKRYFNESYTNFNNDVGYVLTVPVDCPFIPSDLVKRLYYPLYSDSFDIVVASSNGNIHPVIALWSINLDKSLEEALNNGVRKIDFFTSSFRVKVIDWKFKDFDPFFNVNNHDDVLIAESYLNC